MVRLSEEVNRLQTAMLQSIQESIRIPSIEAAPLPGKPYGEMVDQALQHALATAAGLGFRTVNLDGHIGYAEYGEGEDYIAVLGHVDVVPEGSGWQYPPYGAEIHDEVLYGRGSLDDKGPLFAALYGLKAVAAAGLPLKKRVRIIFGTNEETGCADAAYYVAREPAPVAGFTPDANFPVIFAEKGIFNFTLCGQLGNQNGAAVQLIKLHGGERANMVPDACEAVLLADNPARISELCEKLATERGWQITAATKGTEVHLQAVGLAAHGSTPELGKNAVMEMLACLAECPLAATAQDVMRAYTQLIGLDTTGRALGLACQDEPSGTLSLNAGVVSLQDGVVTLTNNARYPVTLSFEALWQRLLAALDGSSLQAACQVHSKPLYFPREHPLITTLHRIFQEKTGQTAEPLAIGGGTYAKTIPNIVAYGPEMPGVPGCCHEANEHISLADLATSAQIYAEAIYELAKE